MLELYAVLSIARSIKYIAWIMYSCQRAVNLLSLMFRVEMSSSLQAASLPFVLKLQNFFWHLAARRSLAFEPVRLLLVSIWQSVFFQGILCLQLELLQSRTYYRIPVCLCA